MEREKPTWSYPVFPTGYEKCIWAIIVKQVNGSSSLIPGVPMSSVTSVGIQDYFPWGWEVKSVCQQRSPIWREALVPPCLTECGCDRLGLKYSARPCCCCGVNLERLWFCPCFQWADARGGMYAIRTRGPIPWLSVGKSDFVPECNSVAKLRAVTITNSYFFDYGRIK